MDENTITISLYSYEAMIEEKEQLKERLKIVKDFVEKCDHCSLEGVKILLGIELKEL